MSRTDVTEKIMTAKINKGIKWSDVAGKAGLSKEWVTAACLGQMPDPKGDRVHSNMSGKFLPYETY